MNLVKNTLDRFVASGRIAGCTVRIMRNDDVLFEDSFGYADVENKVPVSAAETIFPIASMTKVITVAGIMRLYEQGLFKMWDPVSEYLPGFKNPKVALENPRCPLPLGRHCRRQTPHRKGKRIRSVRQACPGQRGLQQPRRSAPPRL